MGVGETCNRVVTKSTHSATDPYSLRDVSGLNVHEDNQNKFCIPPISKLSQMHQVQPTECSTSKGKYPNGTQTRVATPTPILGEGESGISTDDRSQTARVWGKKEVLTVGFDSLIH